MGTTAVIVSEASDRSKNDRWRIITSLVLDSGFWMGVVFILDTKLQAARTALRNGR
jgi:hypothetical protein